MRADCLPQAQVVVCANGNILQEHQTEASSPEKPLAATTYVESTVGAAFAIEVTLERGFAYKDYIRAKVYLDGKDVEVAGADGDFSGPSHTIRIDRAREFGKNGHAYRKFLFAGHQTTDSRPDASQARKWSKLGEIKVELLRCRRAGSIQLNPAQAFGRSSRHLGQETIPEKALKGRAISSHARLGEAERNKHGENVFLRLEYPWGKTPIATYKFKYRSHSESLWWLFSELSD